jgi:putative acetyltransferase
MTEEIVLRQERQADLADIFEINKLAFGQESEAKLVDALRNNPTAFIPELSIVATVNNKIVGHILFTKINIKDEQGNNCESLGLAPMAVRPELQKNGIGGKLIRKGLEVAKGLGFKSVIVLGHEHYYPKFGFEPAEKWNVKSTFDVPSNVFMAIELAEGALKNMSGTVIYPKEFETA